MLGATYSAGQVGTAMIVMAGELYSFKLALDGAQTERDINDAAKALRDR